MCTQAGAQTQTQRKRGMHANIYTHTSMYVLHTHRQTQTHKASHKAWTTKASMWAMNLLCFETKAQLKQRQDQRERAKLWAKYRMFDLTKGYFQNRIQKFQPSGHNYLISKLRFRSFLILSMSCDTDTRRAIVRVIYWLAVCCYVVGTERKDHRSTSRAGWQPGGQQGNWDKLSQP